jgi:hypothetical protein
MLSYYIAFTFTTTQALTALAVAVLVVLMIAGKFDQRPGGRGGPRR